MRSPSTLPGHGFVVPSVRLAFFAEFFVSFFIVERDFWNYSGMLSSLGFVFFRVEKPIFSPSCAMCTERRHHFIEFTGLDRIKAILIAFRLIDAL